MICLIKESSQSVPLLLTWVEGYCCYSWTFKQSQIIDKICRNCSLALVWVSKDEWATNFNQVCRLISQGWRRQSTSFSGVQNVKLWSCVVRLRIGSKDSAITTDFSRIQWCIRLCHSLDAIWRHLWFSVPSRMSCIHSNSTYIQTHMLAYLLYCTLPA